MAYYGNEIEQGSRKLPPALKQPLSKRCIAVFMEEIPDGSGESPEVTELFLDPKTGNLTDQPPRLRTIDLGDGSALSFCHFGDSIDVHAEQVKLKLASLHNDIEDELCKISNQLHKLSEEQANARKVMTIAAENIQSVRGTLAEMARENTRRFEEAVRIVTEQTRKDMIVLLKTLFEPGQDHAFEPLDRVSTEEICHCRAI